MMEKLDFVKLIEDNPITKLSNDYNVKLLKNIRDNFSNFEQQLFLSSFYCYLKYDTKSDYVIDLDNIWKWLGFSQKVRSKELLEKHFNEGIDYLVIQSDESKKRGGHNIHKIVLNIETFKKFCMKADTKKADNIHCYYLKMEKILHEILEEETIELKLQLQNKIELLSEKDNEIILIEKQKQKEIEQVFINQFPVDTECIYFGTIDNTNQNSEKLIKFGHTNDLATRVSYHRRHYTNFMLKNAFKVQNKVEIEKLIKNHPKIKPHIRSITIGDKTKTEIIAYNDKFTIETLSNIIKDIIQTKIYSVRNFNKLVIKNSELEEQNRMLEEENRMLADKISKLEKCCSEKESEIMYLSEKLENKQKVIDSVEVEHTSVYKNVLLPEDEINKKFNEFVTQVCIVHPDAEEISVNLEGRYRLWNGVKPTKEIFHLLKNYMDTRFKPKRIDKQHGYSGIRLKPAEYKPSNEKSDVQTFIYQVCRFSDCGKILNSVLLREYQSWKLSVNKPTSENDMKEIKNYLNKCKYALKSTVWTDEGNNEGYYGISLKSKPLHPKYISSTGKKVYKRLNITGELLNTWNSIASAANSENVSTAKMSRYVKNNTIINDHYYSNK